MSLTLPIEATEVPQICALKKQGSRSERQIWSIAQDCLGYIYVATAAGINVYNGYRWLPVALPLNRVARAVYTGTDCWVYTSGFETFGYIAYRDDASPRYVPVGDSLMAGTNEEMWSIFGNERYMIVQSFADIYVYDYETLRILPPHENVMPGKTIDGVLYIPKIAGGVYQFSADSLKEVFAFPQLSGGDPVTQIRVSGMCRGKAPGELILATQRSGFFITSDTAIVQLASPGLDEIAAQQPNVIHRLESGDYAIGTILNGLYIIDNAYQIRYHLNKNNGLSDNTVLSLYEDQNGDMWVGLDSGLDVIGLGSPVRSYFDNSGVLGTVYGSTEYRGQLILSTNHGIFRKNSAGHFELLPYTQGQAWDLCVMNDVLLCGHNNGTYLFDGKNIDLISDITGGWWMTPLDDNTILQSTYTGLILLEREQGSWTATRVTNGNIMMRKFILVDQTLLGYHSRYGLCIARLSPDFRTIDGHKLINRVADKPIDPGIGMFESAGRIIVLCDDKHYVVAETQLVPLTQAEIDELNHDAEFRKAFESYTVLLAHGEDFAAANLNHMRLATVDHCILSRDHGYEIKSLGHLPEDLPVEIDYIIVNEERRSKSALAGLQPSQRNLIVQLRNLAEKSAPRRTWYMLQPGDHGWLQVPASGELVFRNLPNGAYRLQVKDAFGHEDTIATFEIPRYWYLSWPGGILYVVLFLTLFLLWHKRVERRTALKAKLVHDEKVRELEAERIRSNNERLRHEIQLKSKLLANRAMSLAQKNELLSQLRDLAVTDQDTHATTDHVRAKIIHMVDQHTDHEDEWEVFQSNFDEVHEKFMERLVTAHPELTSGDKRLAAFIRMDLSSKEIAPLLRISVRSVENKRHRLRKKLRLDFGDRLTEYLMRL